MQRPVKLPEAVLPSVATPFGHSATASSPPAIVAGNTPW